MLPPNTPLELTPLRVEQDRAILEPGFGTKAFPIYQRGAAQRQTVGWLKPFSIHV
jgi:hypothetical protein